MTKTNIKSRQSLIIAQIIKLWQKQTLGEREKWCIYLQWSWTLYNSVQWAFYKVEQDCKRQLRFTEQKRGKRWIGMGIFNMWWKCKKQNSCNYFGSHNLLVKYWQSHRSCLFPNRCQAMNERGKLFFPSQFSHPTTQPELNS